MMPRRFCCCAISTIRPTWGGTCGGPMTIVAVLKIVWTGLCQCVFRLEEVIGFLHV